MKSISPDTCLSCKAHVTRRNIGYSLVGGSVLCASCMDRAHMCVVCGEFTETEKCAGGFHMCQECITKDMEEAA